MNSKATTLACLALSSACLALPVKTDAAAPTNVLIVGDSWGVISPAPKDFNKELQEQRCSYNLDNIAISGSTADEWANTDYLNQVKQHAPNAEHIWVTLGGNDAKNFGPGCAAQGKTAEECTAELVAILEPNVRTVLTAIHNASSNAQIVGFGYDIMFGAQACHLAARTIFPQCWSNSTYSSPITCFNTQFLVIQHMWERLAAATPSYVTAINLLGATQVAGGDANATIGNPDLSQFGPAKYWPLLTGCIHPGINGEDSGGMIIMREFYNQYWSKALRC